MTTENRFDGLKVGTGGVKVFSLFDRDIAIEGPDRVRVRVERADILDLIRAVAKCGGVYLTIHEVKT